MKSYIADAHVPPSSLCMKLLSSSPSDPSSSLLCLYPFDMLRFFTLPIVLSIVDAFDSISVFTSTVGFSVYFANSMSCCFFFFSLAFSELGFFRPSIAACFLSSSLLSLAFSLSAIASERKVAGTSVRPMVSLLSGVLTS